jgi:hypothetical protein
MNGTRTTFSRYSSPSKLFESGCTFLAAPNSAFDIEANEISDSDLRKYYLIFLAGILRQGDYTEIMLPRVWSRPQYSFDNFGLAFQTLIEVIKRPFPQRHLHIAARDIAIPSAISFSHLPMLVYSAEEIYHLLRAIKDVGLSLVQHLKFSCRFGIGRCLPWMSGRTLLRLPLPVELSALILFRSSRFVACLSQTVKLQLSFCCNLLSVPLEAGWIAGYEGISIVQCFSVLIHINDCLDEIACSLWLGSSLSSSSSSCGSVLFPFSSAF